MKQTGKQPQNKSTFVRKRNQANDIPVSSSKIKKRIRDVKRTLNKVCKKKKVESSSDMIYLLLILGKTCFGSSHYRVKKTFTCIRI